MIPQCLKSRSIFPFAKHATACARQHRLVATKARITLLETSLWVGITLRYNNFFISCPIFRSRVLSVRRCLICSSQSNPSGGNYFKGRQTWRWLVTTFAYSRRVKIILARIIDWGCLGINLQWWFVHRRINPRGRLKDPNIISWIINVLRRTEGKEGTDRNHELRFEMNHSDWHTTCHHVMIYLRFNIWRKLKLLIIEITVALFQGRRGVNFVLLRLGYQVFVTGSTTCTRIERCGFPTAIGMTGPVIAIAVNISLATGGHCMNTKM